MAQPGARARNQNGTDPLDVGFFVDGEEWKLGDFELGDLSDLEDHFGVATPDLDLEAARVQMFLVFLVRRRRDSDYSLDDARSITLYELREITAEPKPKKASPKKKG